MRRLLTLCCGGLVALALAAPAARAQSPCASQVDDWGDAPECIPAYPTGIVGHFPTCLGQCGLGTQELSPGCVPISSPPGPTGYVHHFKALSSPAPRFWLGCYPNALGLDGVDSESDGKVNTPAVGFSACSPAQGTDCVEVAFGGMPFDQDECYGDATDHGIPSQVVFPVCSTYQLLYNTANCGPNAFAYLNICVDWNEDGDWNDAFQCEVQPGVTTCVYEWAVKNVGVIIPFGCATLPSPAFATGPMVGNTWFRISLTQDIVPDDYPWNGSAGAPGGVFQGGETEDYPATIETPVPTSNGTLGKLKAMYR